jgi:hypothetical protein
VAAVMLWQNRDWRQIACRQALRWILRRKIMINARGLDAPIPTSALICRVAPSFCGGSSKASTYFDAELLEAFCIGVPWDLPCGACPPCATQPEHFL